MRESLEYARRRPHFACADREEKMFFLRLIIINEAKTLALMDGHAVYIEFIFKVMKIIFARN